MAHPPHGLTVGLIVGSSAIWRWQLELIQSLIDWRVIGVQKIIVLGLQAFHYDKRIFLIHQLDGKVFGSPVQAFDLVDVSALSVEVVSYDETVDCVGEGCDLLINLSESRVNQSIISQIPMGVFTPVFSEAGELSSQTLGFRAYLQNDKQVYLSIVRERANSRSHVQGKIHPSFDRGPLSRNLDQYWRWFQQLWRRNLQRLAASHQNVGRETRAFTTQESEIVMQAGEHPVSLSDTCLGGLQLGRNVWRKLKQKFLYQEQWVLLLKFLPDGVAQHQQQFNFSGYLEISPPNGCFWADPFVVSKDGRHYVFFEELPFSTERGHLSCMEVFADGTHTAPVMIIQEPHHLSYPNIFEHDSTYYLIPESGDNGRVDLYRCTHFPYRWEYDKTLLSGIHAYDSTLLEYQGRWWLFATVVPELGLSGCEELYIFHADSPTSRDWQPHSMNPVVSDASRARPGGNFYRSGDQVFRISQDCAGQYGAGLNISKVIDLSSDQYQESVVECHYADWDENLIALHTFNGNDNIAVADALRVRIKRRMQ